jgi:hypothetical protein
MVPRRIILSRKGFDSAAGGCPSPIFPDGTMFSIPIPGNTGSTRYRDLGRQVHLDPDIRTELRPKHAKKECANLYLFGQDSAAQRQLETEGVGIGDLFLFFGLFKCAMLAGDSALFVRGARKKHILWGWLQVGKIFPLEREDPVAEKLNCAGHHPHLESREPSHNCIYTAATKLSLSDNLGGAGIFEKYDDALCLTSSDENRCSFWTLPEFFADAGMTYHGPHTTYDLAKWKRQDRVIRGRSAGRGQEFVVKTDKVKEQARVWLESIFKHAKKPN